MALLVATAAAAAESPQQIIQLHVAALGGRERIAAVHSLRGFGQTRSGGETIKFRVVSARPNRLRLDYYYDNGVVTVAFDGLRPPWELDRRKPGATAHILSATRAAIFKAGADFDDALLAADARGDTIEWAGTSAVAGKPVIRLLVTRGLTESFFVIIDARDYLVRARIDPPATTPSRHGEIQTEYDGYRPVQGVLAPFRITVRENGRVTEEAELERLEANPELPPDIFSSP